MEMRDFQKYIHHRENRGNGSELNGLALSTRQKIAETCRVRFTHHRKPKINDLLFQMTPFGAHSAPYQVHFDVLD